MSDGMVSLFESPVTALIAGSGLWSYLALAVLVAVEGPLVTVGAGVAAAAGAMNPFGVFLAASLGNLTADVLWYSVGYFGQWPKLAPHGRWLGLNAERVQRLERAVHEHAPRLLFLSKLTLSMMVPMLIAAGLARVPWRRWLGVLAAGEALWTGALVVAGYYFGSAIRQMELGLQIVAGLGFMGILLGVVWLITRRSEPGPA